MNFLQCARFWAKVEKREPNECWLWTGCRNNLGYGSFGIKSHRTMLAHRVSHEITNGPLPANVLVLHRCDNPPCVNPGHLFAGTNADNVADCIAKGRRHKTAGSLNGRAKLTPDQVQEIRTLYDPKAGQTILTLAGRFGVGKSQIYNIVRGREWNEFPSTSVKEA